MTRNLLAVSLMSGLIGVALGVAYLRAGRSGSIAAEILIPAANLERSVLHPREPRSVRGLETDRCVDTRFAYHIPFAEIEASIRRYQEKGSWAGVKILFERWSAEDPESAFAMAVKMKWPLVEAEHMVDTVNRVYESKLTRWDEEVFRAIAENWFRKDPERALQAYLKLADSDEAKRGYAKMAISNYAERNPAEAARLGFARLDWKGNIQIGQASFGGNDVQAVEVFKEWAKRDPHEAVTSALSSGIDDRRLLAVILGGVYAGWTERDPEAAERWATELDDSLPLEAVRSQRIAALAKSDPLEALRLDAQRPGEDNQWTIIRAWTERDGFEVFDAIGDTPQPAVAAHHATRLLFSRVTGQVLGERILRLPEDIQQRPLMGLALEWVRADPVAADAFASEIPDTILRRVYQHELDRYRLIE